MAEFQGKFAIFRHKARPQMGSPENLKTQGVYFGNFRFQRGYFGYTPLLTSGFRTSFYI